MDPELVARLVNADAVAQDRIQAQGSAQVAAAFSGVQDWADHGAITTAATEAGAVARSTSRLSAASADAYMTRILGATIGGSPRPAGVISINDPLRVGVRDWSSVYGRVADTVRLQVARGATLDHAVTMGLQRADTMVRWDSGLARREQWRQSLAANPQAIGWRRVIHPELSRGGTCGLCIAAADRIYSIATLVPLHGRCVTGDSVVRAHGVVAVTRRQYSGPLVVFTTAAGNQVTITPNHPVLTDQGWVPADLLQVGDQVVRGAISQRAVAGSPDEEQAPSSVEDLWRALTMDHGLHPRSVPLAPEDFHGDGGDGEVDVVAIDRELSDIGHVSFAQPGSEGSLVPRRGGGVFLSGQGGLAQPFRDCGHSARGLVGAARQLTTVVAGGVSVALSGRVMVASARDALFSEHSADDMASHGVPGSEGELALSGIVGAYDLGNREFNPPVPRFDPSASEFTSEGRGAYRRLGASLLERLAGQVEMDRVVQVERAHRTDHVYNLHTAEGWYSANSCIVSNCHCTVAPVTRTADPGGTLNDEDLKRVYESASSTYAADLKRVRYNVEQHGELGPVLTNGAHDFRATGLVPKTGPSALDITRRLEAEIASLERSYRGLLARAAAGENVIGPLAYQRDRIDALRARSLAIAA